jgi:hypothetical protein
MQIFQGVAVQNYLGKAGWEPAGGKRREETNMKKSLFDAEGAEQVVVAATIHGAEVVLDFQGAGDGVDFLGQLPLLLLVLVAPGLAEHEVEPVLLLHPPEELLPHLVHPDLPALAAH